MEQLNYTHKEIFKSRFESFSSNSIMQHCPNDSGLSSNEFSFNYKFEEIRNVVGIRLLKVEIPFTYYVINETNNFFSWISFDANYENRKTYTDSIKEQGYYTPEELGKTIAKIMSDKEICTVSINNIDNPADTSPWLYAWNPEDDNYCPNIYTHSYDHITNRLSIHRSYGKFIFCKNQYDNSISTIEKCMGFIFKIPDKISENDFSKNHSGNRSPLPAGDTYIALKLGLNFNNFNNTLYEDYVKSNIITIPINSKYGGTITYKNDNIFNIFKHNISELAIDLFYPDDLSIMNKGSGGIPVHFTIEFICGEEEFYL